MNRRIGRDETRDGIRDGTSGITIYDLDKNALQFKTPLKTVKLTLLGYNEQIYHLKNIIEQNNLLTRPQYNIEFVIDKILLDKRSSQEHITPPFTLDSEEIVYGYSDILVDTGLLQYDSFQFLSLLRQSMVTGKDLVISSLAVLTENSNLFDSAFQNKRILRYNAAVSDAIPILDYAAQFSAVDEILCFSSALEPSKNISDAKKVSLIMQSILHKNVSYTGINGQSLDVISDLQAADTQSEVYLFQMKHLGDQYISTQKNEFSRVYLLYHDMLNIAIKRNYGGITNG